MKKYIVGAFFLSATVIFAQTPDKIMSWLPALDGWQKPVDKEVFDPDNLFDRINGAAPLFIENGFQEMTAADYTQGDDYITIQVYRHDTPDNAFGMYSSERSPDLTFYSIGGEAHGDNGSFFFFDGPLYVKMRSSRESDGVGEALKKIAESIVKNSEFKTGYPEIFKSFPQESKVPCSETFVTSNYIGHEFLNSVYLCKYAEKDVPYQLFVINAGNPDGAKEILKKYFTYTGQPLEFKDGVLTTVRDKYNGDIPLLWKGKYLIGIYNENGDKIPKAEQIIKGVVGGL